MKRVLLLVLTLCLITGFSIASCGLDTGPSDERGKPSNRERISRMESRISEMESRIQEQQASYASLLKEYTATLRELRNLEQAQNELERRYQVLQKDYKDLQEAFGSDGPDHALDPSEVRRNPEFKSTGWLDSYRLQIKVEEVTRMYHKTHTYIEGEFDCNDMAVELWNMLLTEGIKSVIAVGNLEKSNEEFSEVNHAWLYIFNANAQIFYLEPTTGEVIYGRLADSSTNPKAIPYREAFLYKKPSDLLKDLGWLW